MNSPARRAAHAKTARPNATRADRSHPAPAPPAMGRPAGSDPPAIHPGRLCRLQGAAIHPLSSTPSGWQFLCPACTADSCRSGAHPGDCAAQEDARTDAPYTTPHLTFPPGRRARLSGWDAWGHGVRSRWSRPPSPMSGCRSPACPFHMGQRHGGTSALSVHALPPFRYPRRKGNTSRFVSGDAVLRGKCPYSDRPHESPPPSSLQPDRIPVQ